MTLTTAELGEFTGTTCYYRLPFGGQYKYTEGVRFMADKASVFWLIADIFAFQDLPELIKHRKLDMFQSWILEKVKGQASASLVCCDGDDQEIYRHHYNATNFPLERIELWLEGDVLLLTSEH